MAETSATRGSRYQQGSGVGIKYRLSAQWHCLIEISMAYRQTAEHRDAKTAQPLQQHIGGA